MVTQPSALVHSGRMTLVRVALALLLVGLAFLTKHERALLAGTLDASLTAEDVYYLPADTEMLEALTLQYREAAADLLWMKALLYYADHLTGRSAAEYTVAYGKALIALDPDFVEPYRWVGSVPFYLSVETPLEMKLEGTRLLVEGSDRLPNDGDLAWEAAATVTYELLPFVPTDSPERHALELDSERLLARAVRLGAGPPWLTLNSALASARLGRTEVAVLSLERALAITDDPSLRAELMARLSDLSAHSRLIELQEAHHRAAQLHEQTFPYLQPSQFLVFGERRLPQEDASF